MIYNFLGSVKFWEPLKSVSSEEFHLSPVSVAASDLCALCKGAELQVFM